MAGDLWLNLATKDLSKSKAFYSKIGFRMNDEQRSDQMVSMVVGNKSVIVNFFPETSIKEFAGGQPVTDTKQSNEVLFYLGADSRTEVDEMAKKAADAGGKVFGGPCEKDGWMYGCGFTDPDGHPWSMIHLDMSKLPKA